MSNKMKPHFQKQFRAFGSLYWESESYDLENSDKLVLPQSALEELTNSKVPIPALLRVTPIFDETQKHKNINNQNQIFDKNGISLIYSFVVDYNAPPDSICMSNWLMKKLGFDIESEEKCTVELTYDRKNVQVKPVKQIQFQPHELEFTIMSDNVEKVIKKSLLENCSSLRKDDIVQIQYHNKIYHLTVMSIGINKVPSQNDEPPLVVSLRNEDFIIELMPAKDAKNWKSNDHNHNNDKDDNSIFKNAIHIENENKNENENNKNGDNLNIIESENKDEESDDEWEILHVDKISVPSKDNNINHGHNSDNKENNNDDSKNDKKENNVEKWICSFCEGKNEIGSFCSKCSKPKVSEPSNHDHLPMMEENLFVISNVVNDVSDIGNEQKKAKSASWSPSEMRHAGWILTNIAQHQIKMLCYVKRINTDHKENANNDNSNKNNKIDVKVEYEKEIDIACECNEDIYLLLKMEAPPVPGRYDVWFQLTNKDNQRIVDLLHYSMQVVGEFSKEKEDSIRELVIMGFTDRTTIIEALKKSKWKVDDAINHLV